MLGLNCYECSYRRVSGSSHTTRYYTCRQTLRPTPDRHKDEKCPLTCKQELDEIMRAKAIELERKEKS